MLPGTNLLKHTRFGHPHLRQFQLSADRNRLLWYTASKGKKASVVCWEQLEGLVLGQKSATFQAYKIPALQHLSFSLVFKQEDAFAELAAAAAAAVAPAAVAAAAAPPAAADEVVLPSSWLETAPRTLDLTCKDELEFETWVTGCKALIAAAKGVKLSKLQLLSHSRRFLSVSPAAFSLVFYLFPPGLLFPSVSPLLHFLSISVSFIATAVFSLSFCPFLPGIPSLFRYCCVLAFCASLSVWLAHCVSVSVSLSLYNFSFSVCHSLPLSSVFLSVSVCLAVCLVFFRRLSTMPLPCLCCCLILSLSMS